MEYHAIVIIAIAIAIAVGLGMPLELPIQKTCHRIVAISTFNLVSVYGAISAFFVRDFDNLFTLPVLGACITANIIKPRMLKDNDVAQAIH